MDELYRQLLEIVTDNGFSDADIKLVNKAYDFACKQHKDMKRKNGEEYIVHPLNVAIIVANLNTDVLTVVSALIHEVVDHGSSSFEEIEELFGTEVYC